MKIDIKDVYYIAKLSKLKFTEEEATVFASEFEAILEHFDTLNSLELDITTISDREGKSVLREDVCIKDTHNDLFRNVKEMEGTYIKVPKIIE